ncbi:MAG: cation-translocating P-type ATPase, partial [Chitinophagaceae bacterium]
LEQQISANELVVGDILLIAEGAIVPADAELTTSNDLSINEAMLTGESVAVTKNPGADGQIFKGTLVVSGGGVAKISAVGMRTKFGKIGASLQEIEQVKTPLQKQIRAFVRNMVWIGAIAFLLVVGFNYYESRDFVQSFLQGLTLAMSILPEEIPVAFSTFQALGAFRLLRNNIIVKQPQFVETLGSATVICTDKTGTITQNKMSVAALYDAVNGAVFTGREIMDAPPELIAYAMWSSETNPFDPMEQAIHQLYESTTAADLRKEYNQVHEYPIAGKPPMMTHIFANNAGKNIIAAKGAPEAILKLSNFTTAGGKEVMLQQALAFAEKGYRVLGVGKAQWQGDAWPVTQQEFAFQFLGLIAFQDPPKENIRQTLRILDEAGIDVKMITGDYAATALAIAAQVNLPHNGKVITGDEVMQASEEQLRKKVNEVSIFARMFPEAKLKVIHALKDNGEVVAMTGDGVNDAPALKAAHIGIAMGARGSEVAKNAASLILVDDDLFHMTEAVALGRKIYGNLKKAIQYIVSIHIPIILIVTLPLLLGWAFTAIFSPVHVIFLELIMGPTCSIIYENEPMEKGTMQEPPRKPGDSFLSFHQLLLSIAQGLLITAGCLTIGYYFLQQGSSEAFVRSIIFTTLLFCNIFLTLVNRSFYYSIFATMRYRNRLVPLIIFITLLLMTCFLYLPFARDLFQLQALPLHGIALCMTTAILATCWVEIWKWMKRLRSYPAT